MAVNPFANIDMTGVTAPTSVATRPAFQTPAVGQATLPANGFTPAIATASPKLNIAPRAAAPATPPAPTTPAPQASPGVPAPMIPTSNPGNLLTDPGLSEQAYNQVQGQIQNDPFSGAYNNLIGQTQAPSAGENYLNQNLGSLNGPGQGQQYWNQVAGQFSGTPQGAQSTQNAVNAFSPSGAASSFFNQSLQNQQNFTGFQGAGNSQNVLGQSQASGPNSAQQFNNQVQGQLGTTGTYSDPNLSQSQYGQTQQAINGTQSADAFYDNALKLGTQSYNQGAASRGVYGSSEALNGIGQMTADLNAQRAQKAFDNTIAGQTLLSNEARNSDLTNLSAFGANLSGLETFGNIANNAASQTTAQQSMLGQQAANADQSAQAAQNSNIAGLNAFSGMANNADTAQTNRLSAVANANSQADQAATNRLTAGGNIANNVDQTNTANFNAQANAATNAANAGTARINAGTSATGQADQTDLARQLGTVNAASTAEGNRQSRITALGDMDAKAQDQLNSIFDQYSKLAAGGDSAATDLFLQSQIIPALQNAKLSDAQISAIAKDLNVSVDKLTSKL